MFLKQLGSSSSLPQGKQKLSISRSLGVRWCGSSSPTGNLQRCQLLEAKLTRARRRAQRTGKGHVGGTPSHPFHLVMSSIKDCFLELRNATEGPLCFQSSWTSALNCGAKFLQLSILCAGWVTKAESKAGSHVTKGRDSSSLCIRTNRSFKFSSCFQA